MPPAEFAHKKGAVSQLTGPQKRATKGRCRHESAWTWPVAPYILSDEPSTKRTADEGRRTENRDDAAWHED